MRMRPSAELTQVKIRQIIDDLGPYRYQVVSNYFEYVPFGDFSVDEQLSFIIAAERRFSVVPVSLAVKCLRTGPAHVKDRNDPLAKPNMIREWTKLYPKHANEIASFMEGYMNVPDWIKQNKEWLCLVALGDVINWAIIYKKWYFGVAVDPSYLDSLMMEWKRSVA